MQSRFRFPIGGRSLPESRRIERSAARAVLVSGTNPPSGQMTRTARFYICPIIGDGLTTRTAFRAKVYDYGMKDHSTLFPTGAGSWCVVLVRALDHSPLSGDQLVDATPDASLDAQWSSVGLPAQAQFKANLAARYGFTTTELNSIDAAQSMRDVLHVIGRKLDANFDISNLDVR